jgi:cysteine desulfurase
MSEPIYLDFNATSPLDERALEAMLPFLRSDFGNPSSSHAFGNSARRGVETAREKVAATVGGTASRVTFTAGATEANNLILKGVVEANRSDRRRILVSAGEHKSVVEAAKWLAERGLAKVDFIPLTAHGAVDLASLAALMGDDVLLVSCVAANSETGVLNPIAEISQLAKSCGAMFHSDATQWVGRLALDIEAVGIDFLSISAHKISGPKGAGAMIASKAGRNAILPFIHGGGQEGDLRSGTVNVPAVVGFGEACLILDGGRETASESMGLLRDRLETSLREQLDDVVVNGGGADRLPNTSNIHFVGADAEAVMAQMPNIAVSTGSACSSGSIEPSHVLTAMGITRDAAHEVLRFSIGKSTSSIEIDRAIADTVRSVAFVREAMGS